MIQQDGAQGVYPESPARAESSAANGLERFVNAREGARFLGIHEKTLLRLAREHTLPAFSFSDGIRHHWRFLLSELDTWMRARVNSNAHPVRSVSQRRRK